MPRTLQLVCLVNLPVNNHHGEGGAMCAQSWHFVDLPAEISSPTWKIPEAKKTDAAPRYFAAAPPLHDDGTPRTL